jgi:hypothetical protein
VNLLLTHVLSAAGGGKGGGKLSLAQGSAIFRNDNIQGINRESLLKVANDYMNKFVEAPVVK